MSNLKKWENNPHNEYVKGSDENQPRSREIAKKYIYERNRDKYSKPWGAYIVHHINGKTLNDTPENLFICDGQKEHDLIHAEQIRRKIKFKDKKEIENFLIEKKAGGTEKLTKFVEAKTNEKLKKEQDYLSPINITKAPFILGHSSESSTNKEFNWNLSEKSFKLSSKEIHENIEKIEVLKEKKKKWKKYFFIVAILLTIILIEYVIFNNKNFIEQAKSYQDDNNLNSISKQPKIESIVVTGSKTDIIIKNNQQKSISLNVTYRIYSDWFGKDSIETKIFEINAGEEKSFKVYNNDGCNIASCLVSILNFEEVND